MSLILMADYYLVNPYWCSDNWFINCTDDELVIGVQVKRINTMDGTLWTRLRRVLREIGVKGSVPKKIYRETGMFRRVEGGDISYFNLNAGICDLKLDGPITVDIGKYLDHGQVIKGIGDLGNHTLWNPGGG